mmetsp:Transcript_65924/g.169667  ORF Transcript_65924/g.169667 Transcript_65924/m.169667 type:complete len:233 (-) Transcript_65924:713-1411(-)
MQRPSRDCRHSSALPDEADASEDDANADRVQQLACEDEHAKDDQDFQPFAKVEVFPGAPQILTDETSPCEEEQGAQEQPRKVVDELRGVEEAEAAHEGVDDSSPAVLDVAKNAVVDDVEFELHVAHRLAGERSQNVAHAVEGDLVVLVSLDWHLGLRGGNLQHAIEDNHDDHDGNVRESLRPCLEVDLVSLEVSVFVDQRPPGVRDLREEPVGRSHLLDVGALPIYDRVEDA